MIHLDPSSIGIHLRHKIQWVIDRYSSTTPLQVGFRDCQWYKFFAVSPVTYETQGTHALGFGDVPRSTPNLPGSAGGVPWANRVADIEGGLRGRQPDNDPGCSLRPPTPLRPSNTGVAVTGGPCLPVVCQFQAATCGQRQDQSGMRNPSSPPNTAKHLDPTRMRGAAGRVIGRGPDPDTAKTTGISTGRRGSVDT